MTTIKRPGDQIRLSDFKDSVKLKPPGAHSILLYRFKEIDAEFGVIKKDVSRECELLPVIDGKIIAWIESYPCSS
jgi:hypothetical protein